MKTAARPQAETMLVARLEASGIDEELLENARAAATRLCEGARGPALGPLDPAGTTDYQALLTRLARKARS